MIQIDDIIKYEEGDMTEIEMIHLFSGLIKSKQAWSLQGHYGRTATSLIQNNILDMDGNILIDLE
jgi:hypothetical protein